MDPLFRLPEAVPHEPAIDTWLNQQVPDLGAIAREWLARMRRCGNDVTELLHDGHPTACVADAAFAYVDVFRNHVNVGFFLGADLEDPAHLLEGTGRRMRHVQLRPNTKINEDALATLIDAAYADIKLRLNVIAS